MKATRLFDTWQGMAPDSPRDAMSRDHVYLMSDWIPNDLGSRLESRSDWRYSTHGPLDAPVVAQLWVTAMGAPRYLAATKNTLYNLDSRESPRVVTTLGAGNGFNPMASLYEYVCIPRLNDQLPVFVRYKLGVANEEVLTTHSTTPKAKFATAWKDYFVLANGQTTDGGTPTPHPNRLFFLTPGFPLTAGAPPTTPAWNVNAWIDSQGDVTGIANTRTSLLVFHASGVERLRGSVPPGEGRDDDVFWEPLSTVVGCTAPHTIIPWGDNTLFCDGRGAYITDGTTVKDLTRDNISRLWRRTYTSDTHIAGGLSGDFWVLTFTSKTTGAFIACFVCNLWRRTWFVFQNVPVISFVTATDTREHLYGGTFDGKVIDLTRMWDENDPAADLIDENGGIVRPVVETAWHTFSGTDSVKRIRNVLTRYSLKETSGGIKISVSKALEPVGGDWVEVGTGRQDELQGLDPPTSYAEDRAFPYGQEGFGFTFRFEATGTIRSLKLRDLSVEGPSAREESYR